tara:strand:- start:1358 stop:1696 length:339 start_codon:yes stop_codon:yes gene_type:complete
MSEKIDWNVGQSFNRDEVPMKLSDIPLNQTIQIKITNVKMTTQKFIVANVESEDLEGGVLWLSGKFGLQNGAYSLMNLVGSSGNVDDIVGEYSVAKLPSDKSSSGYRYEWMN